MKTFFLTTLLFSSAAMAQVNIDQALQIRNEKATINAPGISMGRIDVDSLKKSISSLSGNVSIQFNKNDSLKLNQGANKSGGVIVGSGTNGNKSVVTVKPPLTPKIGLTVTGRLNASNISNQVCAISINAPSGKEYQVCLEMGQQFRLPLEGRYLIYLNSESFGNISATEVSVKNGDQIVIPTREIRIDSYPEIETAKLYMDKTSAAEKQKSISNLGLAYSLRPGYKTDYYYLRALDRIQSSYFVDALGIAKFKSSPEFFNVFPGTYAIEWTFKNGQKDMTYNIVVE